MRNVGSLIAVALVLAACSGDGEETADDPTDDPAVTSAVPTTAAPMTTSTATTTTTSTTTTSTTTTTTTAAPAAAVAVCEVLTTGSYPERREAAAALDDRNDVAALCGDALTAIEQALAIEAVNDSIDTTSVSSSIGLTCEFGQFNAVITNPLDVAIGFFGVGLVRADADADPVAHPDGSRITWSIPPGEQRLLTGPVIDAGGECGIEGTAFIADDPVLPGDAGLPGGAADVEPDPDDPAEWFPLLIERELDAGRAGGATELVALFEDVRSLSFPTAADGEPDRAQLVETDLTVRVCDVVDQPDDDHVALVIEQSWTRWVQRSDGVDTDTGGGGGVWLGAFRRGQDGLWRWLGFARELLNDAFTTCDEWSAARG